MVQVTQKEPLRTRRFTCFMRCFFHQSMDEACQWQALDDGPSVSDGRCLRTCRFTRTSICGISLGFSVLVFRTLRTTYNQLSYNGFWFYYLPHNPQPTIVQRFIVRWTKRSVGRVFYLLLNPIPQTLYPISYKVSLSRVLNFRTTNSQQRTTCFLILWMKRKRRTMNVFCLLPDPKLQTL
jgi:hypothetical protein